MLISSFNGPQGLKSLLLILNWGTPNKVFKNYPDIMKKITIPCLVIQGKKDNYIPQSQAIRLDKQIKNSELIFIESGGHFLPIDTPQILIEIINKWLSK